MTVAELVALLMAEEQMLEVRVLDGEYHSFEHIGRLVKVEKPQGNAWQDKDTKYPFIAIEYP